MIVGRFYELELLNIHLLSQRKRSSMAWQLEFEAVQKQQRLDVEALSQDIIQILCKGRRKFEIFDRRQKLVNELIFYVKNTLLFIVGFPRRICSIIILFHQVLFGW